MTIGPGERHIYPTVVISIKDAQDIIARNANAVLWGYVEYKDIFNTW